MNEDTMHQLMNPKSHHNVGLNLNVVGVTSRYSLIAHDLMSLMLRQSEIREVALLVIRRRGTNAAIHATQHAFALHNTGEPDAAAIWRRIANEITRIRFEERETYAVSLALFDPKAGRQR